MSQLFACLVHERPEVVADLVANLRALEPKATILLYDGSRAGDVLAGKGHSIDRVVVHPSHWGKGFALEAGLAAARDLFDRLALDRVYAGVDPENEKSLRALAKAPGVRKIDDELYELTAQAAVPNLRARRDSNPKPSDP